VKNLKQYHTSPPKVGPTHAPELMDDEEECEVENIIAQAEYLVRFEH
jgi:hypothetical protein